MRPPLDIVKGEDKHYKVETILNAKLTPNKHGIQYLVKWHEYPAFKNSWIPACGMKHAPDLICEYHHLHPCTLTPS